jgi:hypothetical protein
MSPSNPQYEHRILDSKIEARIASNRESEQARRVAQERYALAVSYADGRSTDAQLRAETLRLDGIYGREPTRDLFGNFDPSDALLNHEDDQR